MYGYARSVESCVLRTKGKVGCVNNRLQVQVWPVTNYRHRGYLLAEKLHNKTINTLALAAAWYPLPETFQCESSRIPSRHRLRKFQVMLQSRKRAKPPGQSAGLS